MSTSLRIEELKKKFDENPRRYFAPLANEYRKAGDLQQAIAICQAHLPQQPGHMSGHIVYGQALFEARQFDQARTVFETALALDPENLIALRYLGDIAFELGDRGGARGWYTRVLETDPRNEEIAALMAAMGDERTAPARETGPATDGGAAVGKTTASAPIATSPMPPVEAAGPEKGDQTPRGVASDASAGAPTPVAGDDVDKLFARPPRAEAGAAPAPAPPATSEPGSSAPVSGFVPTSAANAPPPLEQRAPSLGAPLPGVRSPALPPAEKAPAAGPVEAQRGSDSAPPAAGAREAGFVTETMAELYLKQGFRDRALDVYRQLVAQNPLDAGLRERMARVERDLEGARAEHGAAAGGRGAGHPPAREGTVRQFLAVIGSRGLSGRGRGVVAPAGSGPRTSGEFRSPSERPARAPAAGSIDALFAGSTASRDDTAAASALADAFPQSGSPAEAQLGGRPAHPAATELSLDHVFRDGAGAVPSRSPSAVSYDQFFSQAAPPPRTAGSDDGPVGSAPQPGSDDIEQFNAWLQGLKKR